MEYSGEDAKGVRKFIHLHRSMANGKNHHEKKNAFMNYVKKFFMGIWEIVLFIVRLIVKILVGIYILIKSTAYSVSALIASIALLIIALSLSAYLISMGLGLKESPGFTTFREEMIQTHRKYYEQKQEKRILRKLSTDEYKVVEMTEVSCKTDTECVTPNDYLILSVCPYTSKCIQEKCAVICPAPFEATGR